MGTPQAADFTGPHKLLPPPEGNAEAMVLESGVAAGPGIRTQVNVVDYNGDGKLDLLLGDFCGAITLRPDLTEAERKEFHAMRQEWKSSLAAYLKLLEDLRAWHSKEFPGETISDEASNAWTAAYHALKEKPEWKQARARTEELTEAMHQYLVRPANPEKRFDEFTTYHGRVWLYLRK